MHPIRSLLVAAALAAGCTPADDDEPPDTDTDTDVDSPVGWTTVTVPLDDIGPLTFTGDDTGDVDLLFEVGVDEGFTELDGVVIDLAATAAYVTLDLEPPGAITTPVRVGPVEDGDAICETGTCIGVVTLTDDGAGTTTVSPDTIVLTIATLELLADGEIGVCFTVPGTTTGSFDIDAIVIAYDLTEPCEAPPGDFDGVWTSTFTCDGTCFDVPYEGTNTLTIVQDGATATYTDTEGGTYTGTVCGDVFRFSGGAPGFTESGTMTLSAGGATKSSRYDSPDCCSGTCEDVLVR